jgi:hypothetical protein
MADSPTMEVRARLTADSAQFTKGLSEATKSTENFQGAATKLNSVLVTLGGVSAGIGISLLLFANKSFKAAAEVQELDVALQGLGFIVQPPLNKSDATPKQTLTMVYYIAGQEANAANVAAALGGVATAPMPDPVPTETGNMGEASVLVLLATDLAGKPIAGAPAAAATTTVAG